MCRRRQTQSDPLLLAAPASCIFLFSHACNASSLALAYSQFTDSMVAACPVTGYHNGSPEDGVGDATRMCISLAGDDRPVDRPSVLRTTHSNKSLIRVFTSLRRCRCTKTSIVGIYPAVPSTKSAILCGDILYSILSAGASCALASEGFVA